MTRAFVGIVSEVDVGDLCEERARVRSQRVKGESIDYDTENLWVWLVVCVG